MGETSQALHAHDYSAIVMVGQSYAYFPARPITADCLVHQVGYSPLAGIEGIAAAADEKKEAVQGEGFPQV
jgi:hypothetical protein